MLLEGSCQCGAVRFRVRSAHPVPYQRCYCSICRKTQGGGGYAINLGGDAASLEVRGGEQIRTYHAHVRNPGQKQRISSAERTFCGTCGTALWLFSPEWPELIHPFASAIDTPLPTPPEHTHMMLAFKAPWVEVQAGPDDRQFDRYPDESIAEWHDRLGMTDKADGGGG
jgi:hypothetical protein